MVVNTLHMGKLKNLLITIRTSDKMGSDEEFDRASKFYNMLTFSEEKQDKIYSICYSLQVMF